MCPFGDEHILNYVTEFLQQAHAADERYTVRDGINIARFVMKLKGMENRLGAVQPKRRAIPDAHGHPRNARRRSPAVCPSSLESPKIRPVCGAATSPTFPVVPGRLEFGIELRRAILRERPRHGRRGAARIARRCLPAGAGAVAGNVGDPVSRSEGRRARHLCSRGAVRSVHRSGAHRRSKSTPK